MTIAACYLSSEGVVLGADSTTTMFVQGPGNTPGCDHYYNFAQKVFEFGEHSTAGITMWGLGTLGDVSYRTLIAETADHMQTKQSAALAVCRTFWRAFFGGPG